MSSATIGLSPEQIAARVTGIGGSDAKYVLGIDGKKTPMRLAFEKRGVIPAEDISDEPPVRWGNLLEGIVASEYARVTNRKIQNVNTTLRHPLISYLIGNIDRRIVGEARGLEVKTHGPWAPAIADYGKPGTDQIPAGHYVQVQHYCAVTGWQFFDVAVLIGGQDFRIYTVQRDDDLIARMLRIYEKFWRGVETGELPEMETLSDVLLRYPRAVPKPIEATEEIRHAYADYVAAKESERATDAQIDTLKFTIASFLGDHDTLRIDGRDVLTFKNSGKSRRMLLKDEK